MSANVDLVLHLYHNTTNRDGDIMGDGEFLVAGEPFLDLAVWGSFTPPNVILDLEAFGYDPAVFRGRYVRGQLEGNLNGSGWENESVTLTRR